MSLFPGLIPRKDRNPTNRKSSTAGTWPMGSATKVRCTPTPDRLPSGKNGYRVTQTGRTTRVRQVSTAMTKTYADCLRLLPDRRLGSFHRLRDLHHRCPCFEWALSCRRSSLVHGFRTGVLFFGMASTPPFDGSTLYRRSSR